MVYLLVISVWFVVIKSISKVVLRLKRAENEANGFWQEARRPSAADAKSRRTDKKRRGLCNHYSLKQKTQLVYNEIINTTQYCQYILTAFFKEYPEKSDECPQSYSAQKPTF